MPSHDRVLVRDPGRIRQLARQLDDGALSCSELLERCLERIAAVDLTVQAWCEVDAQAARAAAAALDREFDEGIRRGPLHGIPIAIKDVIDVRGLPTRCGSGARQDVPPASADAEVVAALRSAGAVILGKVHTTEFAFFQPSPARNPHDPQHTPGGSSSGSAAAVAAGMVPGALGTQTVASVNRPAAYCGIAAFKPTSRSLSTFGVTPLSPLHDTVGFFGAELEDAVALYEVARGPGVAPRDSAQAGPERASRPGAEDTHCGLVVRLQDPIIDGAAPAMVEALDEAGQRLAEAGYQVQMRDSPVDLEAVRREQWLSFLYEVGQVHAELSADERVGHRLRETIEEGQTIPATRYFEARQALARARQTVFDELGSSAAILWPAAPDVAPKGLESTGDPRYIAPWTGLAGPICTVPTNARSGGLPIGLLLLAAPGTDRAFADRALHMAGELRA